MSEILGIIDINNYGLQNMEVSSGGEVNLQSKDVAINQNGTITITADSGYDGLSDVDVTVSGISDIDWSDIGYSSTPQAILDGYNYAKNIYNSWTPKSDCAAEFSNNYDLVIMPLVDTSIAEDMAEMFHGCRALLSVPLLDTYLVGSMGAMFMECTALKSIPLFNTENVTSMQDMFNCCYSLETIPQLNTALVVRMRNMFMNCWSLTSIPLLDTSAAMDMRNMFYGCMSLTTVPLLDTSLVEYMDSMFYNCFNLTNQSLNNILAMCANSAVTEFKTLKNIGLTSSQAATCETLSNWSAFVAAGWSKGY